MSYHITGIQAGKGADGSVPIRREIDEWWFSKQKNDLNQKSLFIYALAAFQARGMNPEVNDDLSYLNVAGIHGLPCKTWPRASKDGAGFYCAHSKVTFPTWHTPYMLLYEQRLYEEMKALIPKEFEGAERDEMNAAADTWRLPFWDWARKKPSWTSDPNDKWNDVNDTTRPAEQLQGPNVPFVITQPQVEVRARNGTTKTVDNPMFNFRLPLGRNFGAFGVYDDDEQYTRGGGKLPPEEDRSRFIASCRVTSRCPVTNSQDDPLFGKGYVEGKDQDYTKITSNLRGKEIKKVDRNDKTKVLYYANSLPDAVYRLFLTEPEAKDPVMSYEQFATQNFTRGQRAAAYPSLEAIHNNIHNYSGEKGFLGDPATAGFDPLFWLHHCNVDRLLAVWQDLYEDKYREWLDGPIHQHTDTAVPDAKPSGNYEERAKNGASYIKQKDDNPETLLTPFCDANGDVYTSKTCSYKHQEFGYTYPELQKWKYKDDQEGYRVQIQKSIERLYSTSSKSSLLLPENKPQALKQMQRMSPLNLRVEYFSPRLIEEAKDNGITFAPAGEVQTAATRPLIFGAFERDLQWENNDYVVNVVYERFALQGRAYSITLFLGDVPQTTAFNFVGDSTAVGRVYNFSTRAEFRGVDDTGCASCKEQQESGALSSGQVVLTDYLIQQTLENDFDPAIPRLESLDKEHVTEYLQKHLHVRVTDLSDRLIAADDERMKNLKISVVMSKGTHYSDPTQFSDYQDREVLWDVTGNKSFGALLNEI